MKDKNEIPRLLTVRDVLDQPVLYPSLLGGCPRIIISGANKLSVHLNKYLSGSGQDEEDFGMSDCQRQRLNLRKHNNCDNPGDGENNEPETAIRFLKEQLCLLQNLRNNGLSK